ncbi:MAG TPA: hypothetical protein VHE37_09965, partial [Nevskiaceae bacterium]|nr:hypothetical protein [Nevskiaceae bacterium]
NRLKAALAISAVIGAVAPAYSATNQYFLPYDVPTNGVKAKGLSVVNASDFTDIRQIEAPTQVVSSPLVHFAGTPNATSQTYSNPHPSSLVYAKAGHWFFVNLAASSTLKPARISSESGAQTVCNARIIDIDSSNPNAAWLLYQLPGTDAACNTSDDQFRAAHLSDRGTVAPVTLSVTTLDDMYAVGDKYSLANSIVARDGTQVRMYNSALTSSQVVLDGIANDSWGTAYATSDGNGEFIYVNGTLRELHDNGTLGNVVYTDPTGFGVQHFNNVDANNIYFLVHSFSSANTVKLYRVPRDGMSKSVLMYEGTVAAGADIDGQTTNTIILRLKNGATGQKLVAVSKTAVSGSPAPKVLETLTSGFIYFAAGNGGRVYYTTLTLSGSSYVSTAISKGEGGAGLVSQGAGSQWVGLAVSSAKNDGLLTYSYLALLTGKTGNNLQGATLSSFKLSDSTVTPLTTFTAPVLDSFAFAFGSTGLGGMVTDGDSGQGDVFAVDFAAGRYAQITDTPTVDEEVVSFDGG